MPVFFSVDQIMLYVEQRTGLSFVSLRAECEAANKQEGRYPKELRAKLAKIRRVIDGADGYEQVTQGYATATGYRLNGDRGLDLPWEVKSALWKALREKLAIKVEKIKTA